jgi:RNA ligase
MSNVMDSPKYNRTFHLPWSPGGTSDDKIAKNVDTLLNIPLIITEKVDGSNTSLEADGCFARTHAGPPTHLSFDGLKALHSTVKHLIPKDYQIFGEWCYALHSIPYNKLPHYFLMFGMRQIADLPDFVWESWDDIEMWAQELGVATVPVLWKGIVKSEIELKHLTIDLSYEKSELGDLREGVVVRKADSFLNDDFSKYVMKWVRKDHVQTSDHWKSQDIIKNKLKM